MKRREFIALTASAAAMWPVAAQSQASQLPIVGFLSTGAPQGFAYLLDPFRKGLGESGFSEGQNVALEFWSAKGDAARFPALAAEMVRRGVAVIVANGGTTAAQAAKSITSTIPIVFQSADDPVKNGLVTSLNRPGGNLTGFARFGVTVGRKRFELLCKLVPAAAVVAVLADPNNPDSQDEVGEITEAAKAMERRVPIVYAARERDLGDVFDSVAHSGAGALYVASGATLYTERNQLLTLAAQHAIPASYDRPEYVRGGGLMSYASDRSESYYQLGRYAGKILKGAKPADLPVLEPTKFEIALNLKTAKTLGLTVPPSVLAIADEVIE